MQSSAEVKRSTRCRTEMSIVFETKESKQVSTRMTVIECLLSYKKLRNAGESLL